MGCAPIASVTCCEAGNAGKRRGGHAQADASPLIALVGSHDRLAPVPPSVAQLVGVRISSYRPPITSPYNPHLLAVKGAHPPSPPTTMIPLITTTLLLASSALSLGTHGGVRKSLSFGPRHPTAKLNVPSERVDAASFGLAKRAHCGHDYDPKEVATSFVQKLHGNGAEFRIREDSYTDDRTGVTHVYVRQLVNGVEVMDGDINVNVRDGEVISYGDSVRDAIACS
jgi:hypothetical protein